MDVLPTETGPIDAGLVADWTALADTGWPALERRVIEAAGDSADESIGWVARFAHGVTRRANSVYPVREVADEDAAIAVVERWYRERGLPPTFQITDDDALAARLLRRGYAADSETPVLVARLDTVADTLFGAGRHSTLTVSEEPDADWLDLWWAVDGRGGPDELEVARRIVTGGPALYATVRDARGAASVGRLALVEQNGVRWGGLYALATRADARGRGHAR
ncbi:GNAT family N-acetyltransferase, cg3035/Rv0428c family, partial [Humibacter sp.]|uniref:GNAT family N-acetyltransferase, cg3035/Rv0428c family n=1 Tax=Humibacter sp. TaxID=1940291 RepID=UPI003F7F9A3F